MLYSKRYPDYLTTTCLEWKHLLESDFCKNIILNSLRFLVKEERVVVYGFVLMINHFHLLWQIMGDHEQESVQRDFLKYTGQQILFNLKDTNPSLHKELYVRAKDRNYQVWERNSLSIPLWSESVLMQKLEYIHNNPVRAGICKFPEAYRWSSAGFYICNETEWDFLSHYKG